MSLLECMWVLAALLFTEWVARWDNATGSYREAAT